jgi:hypothetical protein
MIMHCVSVRYVGHACCVGMGAIAAYLSQQNVQWENELRNSPGNPSKWNGATCKQANTSRAPRTCPT